MIPVIAYKNYSIVIFRENLKKKILVFTMHPSLGPFNDRGAQFEKTSFSM